MKRLPLYILAWLSTMLAPTQANTVISNDFFQVTFYDEENWDPTADDQVQIKRIVQSTIDHWEDLLANYAPTFDKANIINVSLTLVEGYSSTASAESNNIYVGYGSQSVVPSNGESYNTLPGSMKKLWRPDSVTPAEREAVDIDIKMYDRAGYYFGEATSGFSNYDFHTIFLHEFTHGMGFASLKYQVDADKDLQIGNNLTPFDTLIMENIEGGFELGDSLEFGQTGYGVYNPWPGNPGSNFSHFDYYGDNDNLMKYSIQGGDVYRTLGDAELAVFEAMGYDLAEIVPEPSSVVLVLLVTPACLLRRRRAKA